MKYSSNAVYLQIKLSTYARHLKHLGAQWAVVIIAISSGWLQVLSAGHGGIAALLPSRDCQWPVLTTRSSLSASARAEAEVQKETEGGRTASRTIFYFFHGFLLAAFVQSTHNIRGIQIRKEADEKRIFLPCSC